MLRSCKLEGAFVLALSAAVSMGCGDSDTTGTFAGSASATGSGGAAGSGGMGGSMSASGTGGMGGAGGMTSTGSMTGTGGTGGAGGAGGAGGMTSTGSMTGTGGTGGGTTGECTTPADCDILFGPAPCGAWTCNVDTCEAQSPGCTDADQDGYGTGPNCACAGLDCNDNDDTIGSTASQTCYSGPAGTAGIGTCMAGNQTCTAGVWTPCAGEVTPSGEACNNLDDDCNGTADDNLGSFTCGLGACKTTVAACIAGQVSTCTPPPPQVLIDGPACNGIDDDCDGAIDEDCNNCVPVSLNGNDMTADGTFNNPFQTIQAAINWTVANNGPPTVCVAAGTACGQTGVYQNASNTTVTMADGISVLGNYQSNTWTRCTGNNTVTVIQPRTPEGVTFPSTISNVTVLDGFRVDRFSAATTAAVTVDGAKNAILSGLTISNTPNVSNSYAINVINGGEATITRGRIDAGAGTGESIAVRSIGSKISIQNNCASLDASGRCDDFCGNNPSLRGRITQGTGVTYAVYLQDSPGSLIETSALCANDADQGAAIRVVGNAAGLLIRNNLINAWGGAVDSHGIWMEDCGGAAPWIVDNHYIAAAGDSQMTRVDGIRAIGDCHPVIDSNVQIAGGGEGQASNPNGVHCGANTSNVTSKCVVLGNTLIQGSDFGFPPISTGVRCDNGGCMRIAGNTITGRGGQTSYGVWLEKTGTFVDDNTIRGGCSPKATGLYATDSYARVQNNRVFGMMTVDCGTGTVPALMESYGMHAVTAAGVNEIDVHSNSIYGGGPNVACTSHAVRLDVVSTSPPPSGVGIFRNNILRTGLCTTSRAAFVELSAAADPRIFQNNDLDPINNPMALYLDEGTSALTTTASINGLLDTTASGNISADPLYASFPTDLHIQAGSPCIGAGTAAGAPLADMDGQPRDPATPDIGADEF